MKLNKVRLTVLVILFGFVMISSNLSTATASSTNPVVFGTITDAYYKDLNNQSYLDIQYNMSIYISDFSATDAVNGYYYTLLIGLTYPDGTSYWWQFNTVTYKQSFNLKVLIYDSVTQSGWYTASSYTMSTYGRDKAYFSSMEFDPPSAGVIGDPTT